jgi:hypothetical protein
MTEFDDQGVAIPGSYAIATTKIGGAKADGTPVAFTMAAVCDACGSWATNVCTSGSSTTTNDDIINIRVSRRIRVVAYACLDHYEQVMDSLVDEFGNASNGYEPDDLAIAVDRATRLRHRRGLNIATSV